MAGKWSESSKKWREAHPDRALARNIAQKAKGISPETKRKVREWHLNNPEKRKEHQARFSAKKLKTLEGIAGRKRSDTCELCGSPDKKIHFDHDHATGNFRGWICTNCNLALGLVYDNTSLLGRMIDYIDNGGLVSMDTVDKALSYYQEVEK